MTRCKPKAFAMSVNRKQLATLHSKNRSMISAGSRPVADENAPGFAAVAKQTHDLLKVEELRQGFEQRYYIVLVYPRKASHHGHDELKTLGPPHSDLVTHDALKQTAKKQTMVHVTDMRPGADMVPSVRR